MAKPRVFVSSTYFDLKSVRADLEHFIKEQGYDPVLHERGSVAYGNIESLERYCYKEIENCDILISIIGGRFGTKSDETTYSISQTELRVALEQSKQVYIFVEREVYHEYKTYEKNQDSKIRWAAVDNGKVYEFLSEIYALKNNNPVQPFETSFDITENLKEQWAGLFQRLLSQQSLGVQASLFHDLKQSLETVKSLVELSSAQSDQRDEVVASLILMSHPLFTSLKKALSVPYRFIVDDLTELNAWLAARGYSEELLPINDEDYEWFKADKSKGTIEKLSIKREVFDDKGKLRPVSTARWSDDFVKRVIEKNTKKPSFDDSDDIPF